MRRWGCGEPAESETQAFGPVQVLIRPVSDHAREEGSLSRAERDRARRFRHAQDRAAYIAAHALLRRALAGRLGMPPREVPIRKDGLGKPYVAGQDSLAISLSHTRGLVGCALSGHPCGVDLEPLRTIPGSLTLAESILTGPERRQWLRAPPALRTAVLLRHWVVKEACLKAAGTGLSLHPERVACRDTSPGRGVARAAGRRWRFRYWTPVPGYVAAAVVPFDSRAAAKEGTAPPGPGGVVNGHDTSVG